MDASRGQSSDEDESSRKSILPTFSKPAWVEPIVEKAEVVSSQIEVFFTKQIWERIPVPVQQFLTKVWEILTGWLPSLRLALASFVAGAILTTAAILVPVYSSVENLSEPVTLFETILADLELGYVDPVDTNKLFETGISAMLRSLDPYTEFEAKEDAQQMNEGIMGKYGGVGLVIAGVTPKDVATIKAMTEQVSSATNEAGDAELAPDEAGADFKEFQDDEDLSLSVSSDDPRAAERAKDRQLRKEQMKAYARAKQKGIRVVNAFEGYAFDYGMRVGDRLLQVDNLAVTPETTVEDVRNVLRGDPGSEVTIRFEREGVSGVQECTIPRQIVRLRDVKLTTFLGNPADGIGYISLSGFAANAGAEVMQAILALEQAAMDASNGDHALKGLVLDLRGNPGGLLTSAVDVASLLVPKGSDIVSARGRGFPGVTYRSRVEPVLDPSTKLAVLVNRGTASAAEIVSGAVQDLDRGIIIGGDRTFGKGLVQNVEDLPFNTALKFTVAKYYTPSGRCIQGINYKEGGGREAADGKFLAEEVAEKDRQTFYTKRGRIVKDGGGIAVDYKVEAPKASALEITLLRSDLLGEFAAMWSRSHQLTNNFDVDESTYKDFQGFVERKRKAGDLKLEALYSGPLNDLKLALKQSGYKGSEREVEALKANIVREIQRDFEKYKEDIKEDIATSILSRYVPESMILERGLRTDKQALAATKLLKSDTSFEKLLAKGSRDETMPIGDSFSLASASLDDTDKKDSYRTSVKAFRF
jgi:carboxyl-terminal processing protease